MAQWWGDGDFDWTDAVLLTLCIFLVLALGYTVYQVSNQEPILVYRNITQTEIVYVDRNITIQIPVIEYVEIPVYINNTTTEIIEMPPTPLENFENKTTLVAWIKADDTSEIDYTNRWTCMDFTLRVMENANTDGYRVLFVYWQNYDDKGSSHAVCMAYCKKEAKYVAWEPQNDKILWEWGSTEGG